MTEPASAVGANPELPAAGESPASASADAFANEGMPEAAPEAGVPTPVDGETMAETSAPQGPGALLALARSAQGLSIEDVARQLKFAARQIEALEADRFEVLPGGAAVRGMVRSYARLLRIDAAPVLEAMTDQLQVPDADRLVARYGEPVPFSDGARRSTFVYVALSAVVLAAAALVLFQWRQDTPQAAQMTFVPAAKAPLEPPRMAVASAGPTVIAAAPSSTPVQPKPVPEPVATTGEAPFTSPAAATPVAVAAPGRVTPAAAADGGAALTGSHRIVLRFERASWVEVRDGAGRMLMSKVNQPDTEAVLAGEPPFTLVIGNAQYVRLRYDAQPVDLEPHIKVAVARLTLQ